MIDRQLAFVLVVMTMALQRDLASRRTIAGEVVGSASRNPVPSDGRAVESYAYQFIAWHYSDLHERPEWMVTA